MAIYEITSFQGGISSFNDRGIRGSFKMGQNLDIRKANDTLSCQNALKEEGVFGASHSQSESLSQSTSQSASRSVSASTSQSNSFSASASPSGSGSKSASASASPSGSESPSHSGSASPSPSAGTFSVFEDLILFFVKCSDGNTYGFGDGGHIYRRYPDAFWRMVYTDPDGTIRGAIEKPSSTKTYLQWATGTSVKQKEIPGAGDWSDVTQIANNLTGTEWHTMVQVGGANMICNGSWLAMVGYDDSFTNEALDLIPGNISKTVIERNGRAVVGTYKAGYEDKGINAMIDCEVPLCQIGNDGELYYADFTNSMPIKRFPGGGQVNPGGVANVVEQVELFDWEQNSLSWIDRQTLGNLSLWGVFNCDEGKGGIYTYGRKNKEQPFTLNLEYLLDVDEIGAVTCVEGVILASYRSGGDFGVKSVDSTLKATGTFESLEFRVPIKKAEGITEFKLAEIFMEPLSDGTSIEFWYKMNHAGDWTQAYTVDGGTNFSTAGGKKATFRIGAEGDLFEEKIVLNPSGNTSPVVLRSRVYFY
jgi:hypothetical protein